MLELVTDTMPERLTRHVTMPKTKIYLAARYDHLTLMQHYRDVLRLAGFDVQARWVDGEHELKDPGLNQKWVSGKGDTEPEQSIEERRRFALDDWEDVIAADWVIAFTEKPGSGSTRGGRHVELGIALGLRKRVTVIGPRENVFHYLPQIEIFPDWVSFLEQL